MRKFLFAIGSLLAFQLQAASEGLPWHGQLWEFTFTPSYSYQHYDSVYEGDTSTSYHYDAHHIKGALSVIPWVNYRASLGCELTDSSQSNLSWEKADLSLQRIWLSDVVGDLFSLMTTLKFYGVSSAALGDIGSFYHGHYNTEAMVSLGKEYTKRRSWVWRSWLNVGAGVAEEGSPWLLGSLSWEYNRCSRYLGRVFCQALYGSGHEELSLKKNFKGYGSFNHQYIDVGVRLAYSFNYIGEWGLKYSHRVHAHSAPGRGSSLEIEYLYPFSML
ncbi:MAG: hypothetical protein ACQEP8_02380 [Chlamydiota bacterium]